MAREEHMLNIMAPINSTSYGIVSLNLLEAFYAISLDEGKVCPALWTLGGNVEAATEKHKVLGECLKSAELYNRKWNSLRIWHQFDLAPRIGDSLASAYSFFELDKLKSSESHQMASLDWMFLPSKWAKSVYDRANSVVVCPGVDTRIFNDKVKPAKFTHPKINNETTIFLNCGKWELRKGHDFLLEAFNNAFGPEDNVFLIVNSYNACQPAHYSDEWADYYENHSKIGFAGRIHCYRTRLATQNDVASLMSFADCGIFPSRAEGWNLEAAEMLAMGKNVILTDYSAHTEYAVDAACKIIDVEGLEKAEDGTFFHGEGNWAHLGTQSMEQTVNHLRQVHIAKQNGTLQKNAVGQKLFTETYTWRNAAENILKAIV